MFASQRCRTIARLPGKASIATRSIPPSVVPRGSPCGGRYRTLPAASPAQPVPFFRLQTLRRFQTDPANYALRTSACASLLPLAGRCCRQRRHSSCAAARDVAVSVRLSAVIRVHNVVGVPNEDGVVVVPASLEMSKIKNKPNEHNLT